MPFYTKKPLAVEAIKFTNEGFEFKPPWLNEAISNETVIFDLARGEFHVKTLEGTMTGSVGSYLIRGLKNELYPCRGDIFEQAYEAVYKPNEGNN